MAKEQITEASDNAKKAMALFMAGDADVRKSFRAALRSEVEAEVLEEYKGKPLSEIQAVAGARYVSRLSATKTEWKLLGKLL